MEMGVNRGLGDLEIICVVSCRSADGDKIIEWDLDGLGVGFLEGYNFESGPALRKGDPTQFSHVNCGATRNAGVVPGHKPSCPLVDLF